MACLLHPGEHMDLLSLALVAAGIGLIAVGIGRTIAWGSTDPLPDTEDRRRALIRAETETHDRFGW